jgi:hypothetical protein
MFAGKGCIIFADLNYSDLFNDYYNCKVKHKFRITTAEMEVMRQIGNTHRKVTEGINHTGISMNQNTALQKQMHLPC